MEYPYAKLYANGIDFQIGRYDTFVTRSEGGNTPGDLEDRARDLVDASIDLYSWLSIVDGYEAVQQPAEDFTQSARDFRDAVIQEESRSVLRRLVVALEDDFLVLRREFYRAHGEVFDPDVEEAFETVRDLFDQINDEVLVR